MSVYINCSKSGNKKYLQVVEATYVKRPDGSSTIKRKVLKNLGALEKWDDGKPDFLERTWSLKTLVTFFLIQYSTNWV